MYVKQRNDTITWREQMIDLLLRVQICTAALKHWENTQI